MCSTGDHLHLYTGTSEAWIDRRGVTVANICLARVTKTQIGISQREWNQRIGGIPLLPLLEVLHRLLIIWLRGINISPANVIKFETIFLLQLLRYLSKFALGRGR